MATKMFPFWLLNPRECPQGEQITNGGFEDALALPWTWNNCFRNYDVPPWVHSGNYYLVMTGAGAWINQSGLNVSVECVDTFTLWYRGVIGTPAATVKVTYSDASYLEIQIQSINAYKELDIKPYLTDGKVINAIRVTTLGGTYFGLDDVSLIGKGWKP